MSLLQAVLATFAMMGGVHVQVSGCTATECRGRVDIAIPGSGPQRCQFVAHRHAGLLYGCTRISKQSLVDGSSLRS